MNAFRKIFLNHIINKIKAIAIPITDINDRNAWKLTSIGEYSVETATSALY